MASATKCGSRAKKDIINAPSVRTVLGVKEKRKVANFLPKRKRFKTFITLSSLFDGIDRPVIITSEGKQFIYFQQICVILG